MSMSEIPGATSTTLVYRYGIRHRGPVDEAVMRQVRLAHEMQNDLVRIWLDQQDAKQAVWSAVPRIARVEAEITILGERIEELSERAAKERSEQRAKGPTASTVALRAAKGALKLALAERRRLIGDAREQDSVAAQQAEVAEAAKAQRKALYARYCQDDALYWATHNDVLDHHRVAAHRVAGTRAQGQPAGLRFRCWDGSGSIAVQLQRQAGVPPRTPATIASAEGKWSNVLRLPWVDPAVFGAMSRAEQRRAGRGTLRWYLGHGQHVEYPVIVHRMLPADADITGARLVVRRRGGHAKLEVHVTAKIPAPVPVTEGPVVALHLGWRCDDDRVRVATWRCTSPVWAMAPDVVRLDTDRTGAVVLPGRLMRRAAAHDALRADRDVAMDKIRARLVAWVAEHGVPESEAGLASVRLWKSPSRFAALALRWRVDPPDADVAAELEAWRRADRRLWEPEAHGRAGVVDARDDAYRQVAAWLTGFAGRVVVEDTSVAELAQRADPGVEQAASVVTQRGARRRQAAAPGRLRELVVSAAAVRGVPVQVVPHRGVTRTHYRCGHVNPADDRYAARRVVGCDGCGQSYDQDTSATLMMLAASGDVPLPGSVSAR